jgi:hypothetical protein
MVVETNDALLAAAKKLDAKLQALAAKVTMALVERSPRMASRVLNAIRRAPRAHADIGAIPRGALTGQFSGKEYLSDRC